MLHFLRILKPKGERDVWKKKYTCGLLVFLVLAVAAQNAKADMYLRVIGRDDSLEAQVEKLQVWNAVAEACPDQEKSLASALPDIKKAAGSVAPCRVEIKSWSPGHDVPPADTLYITVGQGQGHNCWGVLYADSLLMAKAEDIPEEPERVEFVWPIWEWILSLFGL